jgi:hypothetical protein
MLTSEAKKLHWLGIDMHARWRRRIAVIATYTVLTLLIASAGGEIDSEVYFRVHHMLALLVLICPTAGWLLLSVFRPNGVVKSFDITPSGKNMRKYTVVGNLDEWARYRYGAPSFEQSTEEQQKELLRIYRVGNYSVPVKRTPDGLAAPESWKLDEREVAERDRIGHWALNRIGFFLAIMAGSIMAEKLPWTPSDVSTYLWSFALLAWTLPQARVLWTEPDPSNEVQPMLVTKEA